MLTPMAEHRPTGRATYQDLLAVDDKLIAEIVDGELYTTPRPAPRHSLVASALGGDLDAPFRRGRGGPGGWVILDEPEIHLGEDIVVPDLAGWRRERMPALPPDPYFSLAPDWACEVLSPGTRQLDRVKKLPVYARERVTFVWLIDPDAETVEVLRLESDRWVVVATVGGNDHVRLEPFAAVEICLANLWTA